MIDYYGVLGLSQDAYWFQVKAAYRKKVKLAHPDRGGTEESFKIIQEAYETLSDIDKRIQYDMMGSTLDTSLRPKTIKANFELKHIIDGVPFDVVYFRKAECDCGGKQDCVYCEGTRIKEDEISIKVPNTSEYMHGATITVQNAGDIDRYGRVPPLAIEVNYNLPKRMFRVGKNLIFDIHKTDREFRSLIENNEYIIDIPKWRKISVPLDNLENNAYIIGKLIIRFFITITDLKKYFS